MTSCDSIFSPFFSESEMERPQPLIMMQVDMVIHKLIDLYIFKFVYSNFGKTVIFCTRKNFHCSNYLMELLLYQRDRRKNTSKGFSIPKMETYIR